MSRRGVYGRGSEKGDREGKRGDESGRVGGGDERLKMQTRKAASRRRESREEGVCRRGVDLR